MTSEIWIYSAAICYRPYDNETERFQGFSWLSGTSYQSIRLSHAYFQICIYGSVTDEYEGFITNKNDFVLPVDAMHLFLVGNSHTQKYSQKTIEGIKSRGFLIPSDLM